MGLINFFKKIFIKKKKTLGISLGSGGAKGMALIGAMKAFEENGIEFDMVAGSSIGSIVGGLYAVGHTADELLDYLKQLDITNPKTLIMLKLKGYSVTQILDKVLGGITFDEIQKPYFAVAVDMISGEEVIINSGNVASAMAGSSAILPIFKPVQREDRYLIDGAYLNSLPSDVLKNNGCDVVIAIPLCDEPSNLSGKQLLDKMYKNNGVRFANRIEKGLKYADLVIEPDLRKYTTTSVGSATEMYIEGYRAVTEKMPEILALLKQHKIKIKQK